MALGKEACTLIIVWIVEFLALEQDLNINAYLLPLVCAWICGTLQESFGYKCYKCS